MSLDERPTPEYLPAQPDPTDSVRRRASNGVPIVIHSEPVQRIRRPHETDDDMDSQDSGADPLEAKIKRVFERLERRRMRKVWTAIGTAIVSAGGALVAFVVGAMDKREAEGVDKQRLRYLEEEVRYLRFRGDRPSRDERPDYPPWPPSYPSMAPAPPRKEP